jgi:peroxiredoxin Q/BCP
MLKAQTRAPDFDLQDDQGQNLALSGLVQAGPLILYFYPADFTPGCTREACTIRDIHDDMVAVGLQVIGVSPQDPTSHARFRQEHALPFTLLSDPDKTVIKMYDVDGPLGIGVRRATFLIGQDQIIHDAMLADVRISRHKDFIQKATRLFAGNG